MLNNMKDNNNNVNKEENDELKIMVENYTKKIILLKLIQKNNLFKNKQLTDQLKTKNKIDVSLLNRELTNDQRKEFNLLKKK
jgi:hypothetical protein